MKIGRGSRLIRTGIRCETILSIKESLNRSARRRSKKKNIDRINKIYETRKVSKHNLLFPNLVYLVNPVHSFVPQTLYRIQTRSFTRRPDAEDQANSHAHRNARGDRPHRN